MRQKRINSKLGARQTLGVVFGGAGALVGGVSGMGVASGGLAVAGGTAGFGIGTAITS